VEGSHLPDGGHLCRWLRCLIVRLSVLLSHGVGGWFCRTPRELPWRQEGDQGVSMNRLGSAMKHPGDCDLGFEEPETPFDVR